MRAFRPQRRSAERGPGAVRVAAGGAAGGLRAAVDIDGVAEGTAVAAGILIGGARHYGPVAPGIRIFPRHRRAGGAAFERIHLRGIGALLVLVVEAGADTVADQAAEQAADRGASQAVSGAAAGDRGTEQRAGPGAEQGAGVFLRSRAHPVRAAGAGGERQTDDGQSCKLGGEFGRGHVDPRIPMRWKASLAISGEAITLSRREDSGESPAAAPETAWLAPRSAACSAA